MFVGYSHERRANAAASRSDRVRRAVSTARAPIPSRRSFVNASLGGIASKSLEHNGCEADENNITQTRLGLSTELSKNSVKGNT